ncbi:MAG: response regulator [Acidobacteriota bacterium]
MKRVLLVDDDQVILQIVAKWLSRYQAMFTVLTAEHGQEALDILRRQPVDVVVTDLQMPVMDGFELIAHLLSEQIHVSIIILTALDVGTVESRLQDIGAFPVVRKPVSVTTLYNLICNELDACRQGIIQGLSLASFLQLLEVEGKSCALRVTARGRVGYLYFCDGDLFHAETGEKSGEAAVYDILLWEDVKLQMAALPATSPARTLQDRVMGLLMEVSRRQDEAKVAYRQASSTTPHDDQTAETEQAVTAQSLDKLALDKLAYEDAEPLFAALPSDESQATEVAPLQAVSLILTLADRLLESKIDASKTYTLVPELRRRLKSGEFSQQTSRLLQLFDDQLTIGEIICSTTLDQASVLAFLANGLKALGLLHEAYQPMPADSTSTKAV